MTRLNSILLLFLFSVSLHADTHSLALLVSRSSDDMFFKKVVGFAEAAADNLGITLHTYYADQNPQKHLQNAQQAIDDKNEAIFFINFKQTGHRIIELANRQQTPIFVFNADLSPEFHMGKPREKYPYWIGRMTPDDVGAGYKLATLLIRRALPEKDGLIHMAAITGETTVSASIDRVKGLKNALEEHPEVKFYDLLAANDWKPSQAYTQYLSIHQHHPQANVIWSASDGIGLGIHQGARELKQITGVNLFTGGVDWSDEGIQAVKDGHFVASMGGHFMEGAWVVILLYDYLNGHDFAQENVDFKSPMVALTKDNLPKLQKVLDETNWKSFDFKKLSKTHRPENKKYDFNIGTLLW